MRAQMIDIMTVVAYAVFGVAFLHVFLLGPSGAAMTSETIRAVTWNIGAGNSRWVEAVKPLNADIVFVQESSRPIAVEEGYHWYGTLDPGTLSRFSAEVLPTERIGPWTDPQLLLMDIHGTKVLVANVRMMLPSIAIQLVDPFHENPSQNYRARVGQYGKLASLLESSARSTGAEAILLVGDFNIPAHMPSLAPLRRFLRDAWRASGSGWGATVPEFLPLARIDQIWLSQEFQPMKVLVVRLEGSEE